MSRPSLAPTGCCVTFGEQYGDAVHGGLVLHTGEEVFWVAQDVLAAPWWRVV